MFCFCRNSNSQKASLDPKNHHYDQVQQILSPQQQIILQLIYEDLAFRNKSKLLTFQNFLLFFGLTGLWGAKLFRQFDENSLKLITKQQFFYGISRTAKAPHCQKLKLLFNFIKDDADNGIRSSDFTKMLYNYSRQELKQILIQDKCMLPQLNRTISDSIDSEPPPDSSRLFSSVKGLHCKKQTVIELNYQQPESQEKTSFGKNYADFSQELNQAQNGTILHIKFKELTYKVNFCNMITLVKDFTKKIYRNYEIDIKNGIFTFQQFSTWIQSHPKLFQSYYTSFHINVWGYCGSQPNFINKIEKSFKGKMLFKSKLQSIISLLVGDVIIICEPSKTIKNPIKVLCLQGLTMQQVHDTNGFGISFDHRDECYQKCILYFKDQQQSSEYLDIISLYQGETLHDLYNTHQMIGTGKFSIVYRATQKRSGKNYALKDISTQKLTSQAIATLDNQSQIMKIISHPNIIKYKQTIRSKEHIYIITEYVYGRDLYEYVRKTKRLSEYIAAFLIGKVIQAVIYLHSLQIIHRDLKPDNIMVMFKMRHQQLLGCPLEGDFCQKDIKNVKIIDFGLANHLEELQKTTQLHGIAGTPNYIPPEVILGGKPSFKGDTFAIGSILYFLLSGKLAFFDTSVQKTLLKTARAEYDLTSGIWQFISYEAKDLIKQLLQIDPEKRISLEQALDHSWFQVVTKKMKDNSNNRNSQKTNSSLYFEVDKDQKGVRHMSSINIGDIVLEDKEECAQ